MSDSSRLRVKGDKHGFTIVDNALVECGASLSDGAYRLYTVLLHYCWQGDTCFPSQDTLCRVMGKGDPKSIRRFMRELMEKGIVTRIEGGLGRGNVSVYEVLASREAVHALKAVETPPFTKGEGSPEKRGNIAREKGKDRPTNKTQGSKTQRSKTQAAACAREEDGKFFLETESDDLALTCDLIPQLRDDPSGLASVAAFIDTYPRIAYHLEVPRLREYHNAKGGAVSWSRVIVNWFASRRLGDPKALMVKDGGHAPLHECKTTRGATPILSHTVGHDVPPLKPTLVTEVALWNELVRFVDWLVTHSKLPQRNMSDTSYRQIVPLSSAGTTLVLSSIRRDGKIFVPGSEDQSKEVQEVWTITLQRVAKRWLGIDLTVEWSPGSPRTSTADSVTATSPSSADPASAPRTDASAA